MENAWPLVTVIGSLAGVFLGWALQRMAAHADRADARRNELVTEAADVLGATRVTLSAMQPDGYAIWARPELTGEIGKRRAEASAIRPRLAALAVRWPDASQQLTQLERYLANTPVILTLLMDTVLAGDQDLRPTLNQARIDHEAAVGALDAAVERLHKDPRKARRSGAG